MNVNNENIKYEVGFVTMDGEGNLTAEHVAFLDDDELSSMLFKLDKEELKILLKWFQSDKKDWAANILLYIRFQKDIEGVDFFPAEPWRISRKSEDLKYWEEFLNKKK